MSRADLPAKSLEDGAREIAGLFGNVEEANAARIAAEIEKAATKDAFGRAKVVGVDEVRLEELAHRYRSAETQALDAAVDIGRRVLGVGAEPAPQVPEAPRVPRGRGKSQKKVAGELGQTLGLATRTVEKFAQLAKGHRDKREVWDAYIAACRSKGEPVTQKGLLAALAGPKKEKDEPEEKDEQIAFRLPSNSVKALDLVVGADERRRTRTDWVRTLVLDAVEDGPRRRAVRLLDRVCDELHRLDGTQREVLKVEAVIESLERAP